LRKQFVPNAVVHNDFGARIPSVFELLNRKVERDLETGKGETIFKREASIDQDFTIVLYRVVNDETEEKAKLLTYGENKNENLPFFEVVMTLPEDEIKN